MSHELKIWLIARADNGLFVIRYVDADTGRVRQKSTGTKAEKEAQRLLGEFRADLLSHRAHNASNLSWDAFRRRYDDEQMTSLAEKTRSKIDTVFDAVESILSPAKLRELTAQRLSYFQSQLRAGGRAESTIAGYLAHLRSALNWAVAMGWLPTLPKIQKPKRAKKMLVMKGRPISPEEFDRMLACTEKVVGEKAAPSWWHYLEGLWWSGLRLSESLQLHWDDDAKLCVTTEGDDLMLRVPAELEKGNKDRLLPIAPEFVQFLRRTAVEDRFGPVFSPRARRVHEPRLGVYRVSQTVRAIGEAAKVVVNRQTGKFASAHDLRRSFGERWASRVMPQVLMELMRHESIETTLKYYVGQNAQRTAKQLWKAYEEDVKRNPETPKIDSRDSLRDSGPNSAEPQDPANP